MFKKVIMKKTMIYAVYIFVVSWLALCAEQTMYAANKRFAVIIPSRNNSQWCERNLEMLRIQSYNNWYAIYINDASTDDTGDKVERFIKRNGLQDKIFLINNKTREGAIANIYKAVHMCDDWDIIVDYDGDDWFSGPETLSILNQAYTDENIWMTYGSYQEYPSGARGQWLGPVSNETIVPYTCARFMHGYSSL